MAKKNARVLNWCMHKYLNLMTILMVKFKIKDLFAIFYIL